MILEQELCQEAKIALVREQKNETLRLATDKLASAGHISTRYPPKWMPKPTLADKLPQLVWALFSSIMIAFFVSLSIIARKTTSATVVSVLAGVYPFVIIITASWLCAKFPLEYVEKLNFRAVQFLVLGACINVVFGHTNFLPLAQINQDIGSFVATALLSLGTIMFSYCTFILGPWEFMAGSPLLAIGLLIRASATYMKLYDVSNDATVGRLNVAASPFVLLALAFVGKKAYQLMRLPILGSYNFRFFGVMFYGGSILASVLLNIVQSFYSNGVPEDTYRFVVSIINTFAFFGTSIFLLDSKRGKDHCNAQLEDRYPSTMYPLRSNIGFTTANWCSILAFVMSLLMTFVYLKEFDTVESFAVEFVTNLVTSLCIALLSSIGLYPSYRQAVNLMEKKIASILLRLIFGFAIFVIGSSCSSLLTLLRNLGNEEPSMRMIGLGLQLFNAISLVGCLTIVRANWLLQETLSKVTFQPSTWENLYHPSNYLLLSSIWMAFGATFRLASYPALETLSFTWAFLLMTLHWNMAFYVHESMTLKVCDEEDSSIGKKSLSNATDDEDEAFLPVSKDCDVLISGGAISGLFLASILGKEGVNVIVCERREKSEHDARFAVINSASAEHMQDVLDPDLFDALVSRSLPGSTHFGSMLLSGLGDSKATVLAAANSPSRDDLMEKMNDVDDWTESRLLGCRFASQLPMRCMQSHQEDVLKMQLARYPHVHFMSGWQLEDFKVAEGVGVKARLRKANDTENVSAKYIVGCDGPSSIVAKKLQVKYDGLLNLANTKSLLVKCPGLYEKVVNTVGNTHQYQILKKNFGLAGIVAADPANDYFNFLMTFGDKVKAAEPEVICKEFLGTDNFEIVQNRRWYWNFFVARNFRVASQAFLCGDSAHSWPPFGGLGGNIAYGDAINLGWKLALSCKGKGSDLLLESYAVERRQQVLQTALYVLRATPNPHVMKVLTSNIFYNPLYMPIIKAGWYHHNSGNHPGNHFSQSGIQFGVKLNFSPTIIREEILVPDDPSCDFRPTLRAGSRFLHLPFPKNGTSTFSYLSSSSYTILIVNVKHIEVGNQVYASIKSRGVPAEMVVMPEFHHESYNGNQKIIAELLAAENVLVIRPDHIIAWRLDDMKMPLGPNEVEDSVSKITGLDYNSNCLRDLYDLTKDAETTKSYHSWLTREFKYNQRPYKFRFPNAVPVDNVTKEKAIAQAKKSMGRKGSLFNSTTRQGDEKWEQSHRHAQITKAKFKGSVGSGRESMFSGTKQEAVNIETKAPVQDIDMIPLSGFEMKGAITVMPMSKLIEVAAERARAGKPVYNFAAGNPSLEPPREILEGIRNLCNAALNGDKAGLFRYTPPGGISSLRKFIAKDVGKWQGIPDLPESQIIITPGAQSAIVNIFEALLKPGDHVITQTPYYPAYEHSARLWGAAEVKHVDFLKDGSFDIDIGQLEKLANESGNKLRLIALCSPGNPTGLTMKEKVLKDICALAESHSKRFDRDVWVVMDNTYWRLTFDEAKEPPLFPNYNQSLVISSFSKDLSLAGERLGYVAVHPDAHNSGDLVGWLVNNNDRLGNISPPSLIQHALVQLYEKSDGNLPSLAEEYMKRTSLMWKELNSIGLTCDMPHGAFYLLPRLPDAVGTDDVKFAAKLADEGVLCVPGSIFGAAGHIRIAALTSPDEIMEGCRIIGRVIKDSMM